MTSIKTCRLRLLLLCSFYVFSFDSNFFFVLTTAIYFILQIKVNDGEKLEKYNSDNVYSAILHNKTKEINSSSKIHIHKKRKIKDRKFNFRYRTFFTLI